MCHLILFMPILTLPILWLMPLNIALPVYLVLAILSGWLYWVIARVMNKKVNVGVEGLIGAEAEVISQSGIGNPSKYLVRSRGELWTARSNYPLQIGEKVSISMQEGVRLFIERTGSRSHLADTHVQRCH